MHLSISIAPASEDFEVTARLHGQLFNRGKRTISSLVVNYDCNPDSLQLSGSRTLGPISAEGDIKVDEVLRTFSLPGAMYYSCSIEIESLRF